MSQFNQPGSMGGGEGDKFTASEHQGCLLLFFPTEYKTGIQSQHGTTDAVGATVVNLDQRRVLNDVLIFGTVLRNQLKDSVPDGMVLGRLAQGENSKGNPPWILLNHDGAGDVQAAEAYLAANPRNQFAQPQQQAPAPQAQAGGWGAPQQQAAPAQGGWGAPAPQAAPAPAQGGWGQQAAPAPQQSQFDGQWGGAAPAAPPAPAAPQGVDPNLVAALQAKGVNLPPNATMETALQLAAVYGLSG